MTSETAPPAAPARAAPTEAVAAANANAADGVVVRRVETPQEYQACVAIERETWGADFREYVPATILMVAQKLGGVVAGAFAADGAMLGFVFGMAGVIDGRPVHWSDMLAVRPEARGAHVGERLKRYQRVLARTAGAEAMYWTFDPLIARNAHLNLARLGARVVEYVPNMYGDDTGSPLHGGLPTDRLVARWNLAPDDGASGDGASHVPAPPARPAPVVNSIAADGTPTGIATLPDDPLVRITVPHDFHDLPPALRAAWRVTVRDAFLACFRRGYQVTAFRRAMDDALPYYELSQ